MRILKLMVMSLLIPVFFGCKGQTSKPKDQGLKDQQTQLSADTLNQPQINVNVNKQYDDKGRIVQFDSTYSYFYSSPKGPLQMSNDSIFNNFESFFDRNYPDFFHDRNNAIFFNDSLFKYDFFNKDYFQKRFELNQKAFQRMYQQMDSLKGSFLQKNYPQGYQKKKSM